MPRRLAFFLFILQSIIHYSLNGNTLQVPGAYATIQSAINATQTGDTVLVAPGTYFENLNFHGKNIVVSSFFLMNADTGFVSQTIINGSQPQFSDTASCVLFISGETNAAVLQGFTLTEGRGTRWPDSHIGGFFREGGGILTENSSPTIQFNRIIHNEAINTTNVISAGGGAIRCDNGNPHILNNVIEYNQGKYGAGIVLNYSGATILNNIIAHNTGGEGFGGSGIWDNEHAPFPVLIENNTIVENVSAIDGGGILIWATSATIRNNIIWGNIAPAGPQIRFRPGGSADVTFCDVEDGWQGDGNINEVPLFSCIGYYLTGNSPCVDQGDGTLAEADPESIINPGIATWPSRGTTHSDIGAYGGPGSAILPILEDFMPPQLVSPPDEVFDQPQTIEFRWNPNTCGGPYHFQLANDTGFVAGVFIDTTALPDTSVMISGIPDEAVYYWRVQSSDISIGNVWSSMRRLVVGGSENSVEFDSGWGLISFPFRVDDPRASVVIPPVHSLAYQYNGGGYITKDTLQNGIGYWMRLQNRQAFTFIAHAFTEETIEVSSGWNLIGSISSPIDVADIVSDPPGMVTSQFFGYNGTYVHSDSILPCRGYWVNVESDGKLILSTENMAAGVSSRIHIIATDERPPTGPTVEYPDLATHVPTEFQLMQNYPNPFNPVTVISYQLPVTGYVVLKIYNVYGQEVETLVDEEKGVGAYAATWNGNNAASGIYYAKMTVRNGTGRQVYHNARKLVLMK